ncbi:MAG: CinA family protein [Pararhodobacter sp.]|nr:CinA family protein [Pararhodobacter sp.]
MRRLKKTILTRARDSGKTIATAESCTGGMIAAALTDLPGSSSSFIGGFVTYSNEMKRDLLNVDEDLMAHFGAVSEQVAAAMAEGARAATGADIAASVTGIAGPGGSEYKPEGRVCFALASAKGTQCETVDFGALGRARIRRAARDHALTLIAAALG